MPVGISALCAVSGVALLLWGGCEVPVETGSDEQGRLSEPYWPIHIVGPGDGADGVALYDIDGDHDLDAAVAFEEEGKLRLYFNPALPASVGHSDLWPSVQADGLLDAGKIEDAIFADFDGDSRVDALVSAMEGSNMRVGVHWLRDPDHMTEPEGWLGESVSDGLEGLYLRVAVGQIDGRGLRDIVAGSKTKNGFVGAINLFLAPAQMGPGASQRWRAIPLATAKWTVGLEIVDIDGDGDNDVLYSTWRKLGWLRNPGGEAAGFSRPWDEIVLSGPTGAFAFCDLDRDGDQDIVKTTTSDPLIGGVWLERLSASGDSWKEHPIRPVGGVPRDLSGEEYVGKGIACGNIDGDAAGNLDIVITSSGQGHGVYWLEYQGASPRERREWTRHLVSESTEMKYDNVVLADVDLDSDLDIVTTEENAGFWGRGLGAVWYENRRSPIADAVASSRAP